MYQQLLRNHYIAILNFASENTSNDWNYLLLRAYTLFLFCENVNFISS